MSENWIEIFMWVSLFSVQFFLGGFPGGSEGEESTCNVGDLGWEEPLEEAMATHSSIFA